jgi:hypothetical protein
VMLYRRVVHVRSQCCGGNRGKDSQQAVGTHATLRMLLFAYHFGIQGKEGCLLEAFSPVLWSNGTLTLHFDSQVQW